MHCWHEAVKEKESGWRVADIAFRHFKCNIQNDDCEDVVRKESRNSINSR